MHIGVKNRTKEAQDLTYGGRAVHFEPGQVRLIEGVPPDFVETRVHVSHQTKENPKTGEKTQLQALQGLRLFEVLTVDEALKAGARPDEDPRVISLRAEVEAKAKERAALLEDLKSALVADGWAPPTPPLGSGKTKREVIAQ